MSDDLVEFLTARLDERQALATAVRDDLAPMGAYLRYDIRSTDGDITTIRSVRIFEPDEVLADVAARRRIVEPHRGVHRCEWGDYAGGVFGSCLAQVLRLLALPNAAHPDYCEEWTP